MTIRQHYWRVALIAIIVLLGILLFKEALSYLSGLLGAFTVYIVLRKQLFYLIDVKKMRTAVVAILLLLETIILFVIPISLAVWLLVNQVSSIHFDTGAYMSSLQKVMDIIKDKVGYDVLSKDNIASAASYLPKIGRIIVSNIGQFTVNAFVLLFILYFMFIGNRRMEQYIYDILPFNEKNKRIVLNEIGLMVKANALAIPLLALLQGFLAALGYVAFGISNPILLGFFTCFATIIPLIGTAVVWFPIAFYTGLSGHWLMALGIAAYSLLIVANIDNLCRFLLQKKMADTHPLITIFGVILGLSLFGFWGVIFGPILLSVFLLCCDIFKREYLDKNRKS